MIGRPVMAAALLALATSASADVLSAGAWSPVTGAVNPFWGGASSDCAGCGIGHVLESFPDLEYLHGPGNQAVAFALEGAAPHYVMLAELADYAPINELSWLGTDLTQGVIFAGADTPHGVGRTITAPARYQFQFSTVEGWFYSDGQHFDRFAVFRSHALYFVGIEDLLPAHSDHDYNDLVVALTFATTPTPDPPTAVPEVPSLGLLGAGLLWLLGALARDEAVA